MRPTDVQCRTEQAIAVVDHFDWYGLKVHTSKRGYLDLLLESAGRVAHCARLEGRRRLMCVAGHCGVDRSTLVRELAAPRKSLPKWETLERFAHGTEVPVGRFLVALEIMTVADLAAALGQEAPQIILSPSEREWLRVIRSWTPQESRHHFGYVSLVKGLKGLNLDPDADQT